MQFILYNPNSFSLEKECLGGSSDFNNPKKARNTP